MVWDNPPPPPPSTDYAVIGNTAGNATAALEGNPDIAVIEVSLLTSPLNTCDLTNHIKVVLSFIISAHLCLPPVVVCYLRSLLPNALLNDYDRQFVRLHSRAQEHWFEALSKGILNFSDSQTLQGTAILTAAFVNIKTLAVYHWQIVIYMAW